MHRILQDLTHHHERIGHQVERLEAAASLSPRLQKGLEKILGHLRLASNYLEQLEIPVEEGDSLFPDLQVTLANVISRQIQCLGDVEDEDDEDASGGPSSPSLHGDTRCMELSELIGCLNMQDKDGVLEVCGPTEIFTIVFERGFIVHAYSNNSPEGHRLGDVLIEQGAIGATDLQNFLLLHSWSRAKLGEALRNEALVTSDELQRALETQVLLLFRRLFTQPFATFQFTEGLPDGLGRELCLNPTQLLLESARQSDEERRADDELSSAEVSLGSFGDEDSTEPSASVTESSGAGPKD